MDVFDKIYKFIKPFRGVIAISLLLLALSAVFDFLLITLVIPLFDQVLTSQPDPQSMGVQKFAFLQVILDLVPGSIVWQISLLLVALTLFKGVCLYCSNYLMGRVGQGVLTDLRNVHIGPF